MKMKWALGCVVMLLCGCAPRQPTFRLAGVLEADEISPATEPHQNIDDVTVGRNGAVYVAADGREVWSASLPSKEESGCDHVNILGLEEGVLVCGNNYGGAVVGIDLASRKVRWRTQVEARDMRYDKGWLYTVTVSNVVCRVAATGTPAWERKMRLICVWCPCRKAGGRWPSRGEMGTRSALRGKCLRRLRTGSRTW